MRLATLRALGFDASWHVPFTREFRVRCSSCAALVINGVPCHESGCPNQRSALDADRGRGRARCSE